MPSDISYSDLVLHDYSASIAPRFVHMGHWDQPLAGAPDLGQLADAQERMNDIVLDLLGVGSGSRVLDVGCGLGGSIEVLDHMVEGAELIGVNIDPSQLLIARELAPAGSNRITWIRADACSLPLRHGSVDRLLCLEAMMHFRSRSDFLAEAARVLRPGSRMVTADMTFRAAAADVVGLDPDVLADLVHRHLGPWPDLYAAIDEIDTTARQNGFQQAGHIDATGNTAPTFGIAFVDGPKSTPGYDQFLAVVDLVHQIHLAGALRYTYSVYER